MSTGQRISSEEALDHFGRGQIYGYLMANPGTHHNELKRVLNMRNGALSYHLRILEDKGYVQHCKDGRYTRFYLNSHPIPESRTLSDREEEIIDHVNNNPGCSQKYLAESVGIGSTAISYSVRQLARRGFIRTERNGIRNAFYPVAAIA